MMNISSANPPSLSCTQQKNDASENIKYKYKYKKLKRLVESHVYLNAALHDEIVEIEQKVLGMKTERKLLLKKLFQYLPMTESQCLQSAQVLSDSSHLEIQLPVHSSENNLPSITSKKIHLTTLKKNPEVSIANTSDNPASTKKSTIDSSEKGKRKRPRSTKKKVQSLHLNDEGAPLFPVTLGTLTVYDLGEVYHGKSGFHSERYIWPVGYCSTRLYPSMLDPDRRIQYFCYILDGDSEPLFKIIAEDEPDNSFTAATATACHCNVLKRLNKARGKEATNTGSGPEFFGFSHPTIQYLIQCLPGVEKCDKYVKQEYEFQQTTTSANVIHIHNQPNMTAFDRTTLELPKPAEKTIDMR